jgi:RecA-family ATPase
MGVGLPDPIRLRYLDGGAGKSMFAFRLAFSIALGELFLGRAVQQGDVLILDAELNESEALRRFIVFGAASAWTTFPAAFRTCS